MLLQGIEWRKEDFSLVEHLEWIGALCARIKERVWLSFFTLCGGLGVVVFGFCQFGVPCGFLFAFCHVDNAFFHLF